jgi:hypothetical protein
LEARIVAQLLEKGVDAEPRCREHLGERVELVDPGDGHFRCIGDRGSDDRASKRDQLYVTVKPARLRLCYFQRSLRLSDRIGALANVRERLRQVAAGPEVVRYVSQL